MARYKYKHTYSWNRDLAYVVGLLASDGCLIGDGRHIDFTSKDRQLVEYYRLLTKPHIKIGIKRGIEGQEYFRVQLGDVAFYDFLVSVGLCARKSKVIKSVDVPDEFYPDFLRGYFDGDGSIYSFWDKRWKNSLMFYTTYTSASDPFLSWMRKQNIRLVGAGPGSIRPSQRAKSLGYAKKDSRLLFRYMYGDGFVPKLSRKYERFVDLLEADPYANQGDIHARVAKLVAAQP